MYENFIFEGGSYKHGLLVELIEDLGGYIITNRIFSQEATITFMALTEDYEYLKRCADEIGGEIKKVPLLGTEIAVVTPALTRHHLPHHLCDVAEYLRRKGAQTNMIGLARGTGRRIAQISQREKRLIEEYDVAVICLGNFKRCIEEKLDVFLDLNIPLVISGLPYVEIERDDCVYVEGMGRLPYNFKHLNEIELLKRIADGVERCTQRIREEIIIDPPIVPPFALKDEVERQIGDVKYGLAPGVVVLRTKGLRIKIPFNAYADDVSNVDVMGYKLWEVSEINPSVNRYRILVDLLPESLVEV
jgi:putative methanogenesis marker protein 7